MGFVARNAFVDNDSILTSVKAPENQRFPGVFRVYKMGTLATNKLN